MLKKLDAWEWIVLIWLRTRTSGGLFCTRRWTCGLCNMRGISLVAEGLLTSQEGLFFHGVSNTVYDVFPAGPILSRTYYNCYNLFTICPYTTLHYITV